MLRSRGGSAGLPTHGGGGGGGSFSSHGSNHSSSQYMSSPTQHSHDGGGGYGGNHRSSSRNRSSFVSGGGSSNDRLLQVLSVIFLLVGISCTWSYRSYQQWPPQMEALLIEEVKKTGSSSSSSSSWDQLKESHEDLMELIRESKWEWRKKQNSLTKEKRQQVKDLEAKLAELKKDRDALQEKYKGGHRQLEQKKHIQKRESGFQDLMETLQLAIRKESKRTVLERFGPGPHEVELTYVVGAHDENKNDGGDNNNKKEYKMVLEMAKLNIVPHAIHLFLEQVEHGLWNNTYLYLNSPRIAKMGPLPVFDDDIAVETTKTANSNDDDKMKQYKKKLEETQLKNLKNLNVTLRPSLKPFCDAELDALQFPDYSHSFPHRPWTVAFAGRPGGPDIYINKRDNAHLHGPYGQENFYVLEEQGDACFAKITRGRETLENVLLEQPFHSEDDMLLHPIIITQAVLLTEKPQGNEPIHMLDDEDTSSSANEIPPPMEWVFGNTLSEALREEEQTMIEIEEEKTQEGDELKIIESLAEQQVANEENNPGKEEEQDNNNDRGEVDPMTIK